jgi:hypothetical protein
VTNEVYSSVPSAAQRSVPSSWELCSIILFVFGGMLLFFAATGPLASTPLLRIAVGAAVGGLLVFAGFVLRWGAAWARVLGIAVSAGLAIGAVTTGVLASRTPFASDIEDNTPVIWFGSALIVVLALTVLVVLLRSPARRPS